MKRFLLIFVGLLIWASGYGQELFRFTEKGKWGFRDASSKVIISAKFNNVRDFSEGFAAVQSDGKWGYIDKKGKKVIPIRCYKVSKFSDGLAAIQLTDNNQWGYINTNGKIVISSKYIEAGDFSNGIAKVSIDRKYGYIDKTGKELIPIKYDRIEFFVGSFLKVELNKKFGLIDINGKEIVHVKYDKIDQSYFNGFSNLRIVEIEKKYGLIDVTTGKEFIPAIYESIRNVYNGSNEVINGLIKLQLNNYYGLLDNTGKEITPMKYNEIYNFSDEIAKVSSDGKWGYIDRAGNEVVYPMYSSKLQYPKEGISLVEIDGKGHLISNNQNIKYTGSQMKIIGENILDTYHYYINDYLISLEDAISKCETFVFEERNYGIERIPTVAIGGSFVIQKPYVVVNSKDMIYEFSKYSENNFNKISINGLKTLIINYQIFGHSKLYNNGSRKLSSYKSYLIYFDVEKKTILGHDVFFAERLPDLIMNEVNFHDLYVWSGTILEKIQSRIVNTK